MKTETNLDPYSYENMKNFHTNSLRMLTSILLLIVVVLKLFGEGSSHSLKSELTGL